MPLAQIQPTESGQAVYDKINSAITEAGRVAEVVSQLEALKVILAPYVDLVGAANDRPGDARTLFTSTMTGSPKSRPAIAKGTTEDGGDLGQVLRISGADSDPVTGYVDVAPRRAYFVRPGRAYLVQHAFARFEDPTDPEQNAVELRLQNLSSTFGQVSNVRLGDAYAPLKNGGSIFVDTFIGKEGSPGTPSYVIPNTSRYVVPFFRIYGNGQKTDLGVCRVYDISDALAGGADVSSIIARIAKLESIQASGQTVGFVSRSTWSSGGTPDTALSLAPVVAYTIGKVPDSDTGSHAGIASEAGYGVPGAGLVPNAGLYTPVGSPLTWRRSGDTSERASAALILSGATIKTTMDDTDYIFSTNAARNQPSLITVANFKDLVMERFLPQIADRSVDTTAVMLVPADPTRNYIEIINTSNTDALLLGFGAPPVEGQRHTLLLTPGIGAGYEREHPRQDSIWVQAKTGVVEVFANYCNRSGSDVVANLVVDAYLARGPNNQSSAERAIYLELFKDLRASGAYRKMRTAAILGGSDGTTALVDLMRPQSWTLVGAPVFTKGKGYKGNGNDQCIKTGYYPKSDAGHFNLNSHSFGAMVDNVLQGTNRSTMGSVTTGLDANRAATSAAARSGTTATDVIASVGLGGFFGVSRSLDAGYRFAYNNNVRDVASAVGSFGTGNYELLVLSQNGSSGSPTNFSTIQPSFVWAGETMTDAELVSINPAMTKFLASYAALGV